MPARSLRAYAAHVLDVYEHYRWRWRDSDAAPGQVRGAEEKKRSQRRRLPELWKKTMAAVGESTINKVWNEASSRPTPGRIITSSTSISWPPKPTSGPRSKEWALRRGRRSRNDAARRVRKHPRISQHTFFAENRDRSAQACDPIDRLSRCPRAGGNRVEVAFRLGRQVSCEISGGAANSRMS